MLKSVRSNSASFDEMKRVNLLIKRYTVQVEMLDSQSDSASENGSDEDGTSEENGDLVSKINKLEWQFRDSILKCLYSQDFQYPTSNIE